MILFTASRTLQTNVTFTPENAKVALLRLKSVFDQLNAKKTSINADSLTGHGDPFGSGEWKRYVNVIDRFKIQIIDSEDRLTLKMSESYTGFWALSCPILAFICMYSIFAPKYFLIGFTAWFWLIGTHWLISRFRYWRLSKSLLAETNKLSN